jgi:hypothetical protein
VRVPDPHEGKKALSIDNNKINSQLVHILRYLQKQISADVPFTAIVASQNYPELLISPKKASLRFKMVNPKNLHSPDF